MSRVAFSTDHAKRPIRSEVMFFSCASAWRDPSKWSGNMRSRRSLPNARSSSSASHFEPYHERVASMMRPIIRGSASTSGLNAPVAMASSTSWTLYAMSSDRSMTWHSMGLRASGAPVFSQRNTSSSSGYTQNFTPRPPSYLAASARVHGYLTAASSEALVRFTPAERPSG